MKEPNIALQSWTIRRELKLGAYAERLLRRINSYGIEYLELGGTGGRAPEAFQDLCKRHGFQVMGLHEASLDSAHLNLLLKEIGRRCEIFDVRFVTVSWDTFRTRNEQSYAEYADLCSRVGSILRKDDITFCYHCFDFDLVPLNKENGPKSGLDVLLERTSEEDLLFQLDTFFIWRAKCELEPVLDKCGRRCKLVHLDDIDNDGAYAPLGRGIIPWPKTIAAFVSMCPIEWFIIEHETQRALDWVYQSYRYWTEELVPLVERMVRQDGQNIGQ